MLNSNNDEAERQARDADAKRKQERDRMSNQAGQKRYGQ